MDINSNKQNKNMKIFNIVIKLNFLSFNILLNFALLLGFKNGYKNKDIFMTDVIKYLNDQDNKYLDNF